MRISPAFSGGRSGTSSRISAPAGGRAPRSGSFTGWSSRCSCSTISPSRSASWRSRSRSSASSIRRMRRCRRVRSSCRPRHCWSCSTAIWWHLARNCAPPRPRSIRHCAPRRRAESMSSSGASSCNRSRGAATPGARRSTASSTRSISRAPAGSRRSGILVRCRTGRCCTWRSSCATACPPSPAPSRASWPTRWRRTCST